MKQSNRLLFIPLDSRPCCSVFFQRLAGFRGVQLCMPPAEMLGNLECRGDSEKLWSWLEAQDSELPAVVSVDMLFWGGLVGSRRPADMDEELRQKLGNRVSLLCARDNTFAFNTIMRVAPTQKTTSEIQEAELLIKASQLLASHYGSLEDLKEAFTNNQAQDYLISQGVKLPNQVWRDYLRQRQQKSLINSALVREWKSSCRDSHRNSYLLFGFDDCQTHGFNLLEGNYLNALAENSHNIAITTGTDELAQLLLARYAASGQSVGVVWNSAEVGEIITRYEDCSLTEVLQRQAKVTQTNLIYDDAENACRKVLFIWGPRGNFQEESFVQRDERWPRIPDSMNGFFERMRAALDQGKHVVLADIYAARELDIYGISSRDLQDEIRKLGTDCDYFPSFGEIEDFLRANVKEGDLVIALDEENRNTLKKYGGKDRKTRKVILEYCNKAVYGDKKILVKHLVCQGVVSHIIKKR